MSITKTIRLVPLIALLVLLASNLSCISLSSRGIGGDWNPSALSTVEVSRLPLSELDGYGFNSTIITSQTELEDLIHHLQSINCLTGELVQALTSWQIDFSTHNLILYKHTESSGSIRVSIGEPQVIDNAVVININRESPMMQTDNMAYYYYAYKVSKSATSVTFVVEGGNDTFIGFNEVETITSGEPSLTTTIAKIECEIEVSLLIDSHLHAEPPWSSYWPESRLTGLVTIKSIYADSIPGSWSVEDEVIITNSDRDTWVTEFADKDTPIGLSVWKCSIGGGPQWEVGTTASIAFRISAWYVTTIERVDKTYTVVINNVPIRTCR